MLGGVVDGMRMDKTSSYYHRSFISAKIPTTLFSFSLPQDLFLPHFERYEHGLVLRSIPLSISSLPLKPTCMLRCVHLHTVPHVSNRSVWCSCSFAFHANRDFRQTSSTNEFVLWSHSLNVTFDHLDCAQNPFSSIRLNAQYLSQVSARNTQQV